MQAPLDVLVLAPLQPPHAPLHAPVQRRPPSLPSEQRRTALSEAASLPTFVPDAARAAQQRPVRVGQRRGGGSAHSQTFKEERSALHKRPFRAYSSEIDIMGIQGLLPLLKPCIIDRHIAHFRNRRVAVDTYAWLHRAVYSCAADLCNGVPCSHKWIGYCLGLVDMLLHFEMTVWLVFDGQELPAKRGTEAGRAASRAANLQKAHEFERNHETDKAFQAYTQAVDVTPRMAAELIAVLRQHRPAVRVVVAPYEADAQLSYLCKANLVDCVISEDSDTVPFGCTEVLFKLKQDGSCCHLRVADIFATHLPGFDLRAFSPEMLMYLCITAGCDYLPSCRGVGIKTGYEIVRSAKEPARILKKMRMQQLVPLTFVRQPPSSSSSSFAIAPPGSAGVLQYEVDFYRAVLTFRHQTVYDVEARRTRHLSPFDPATLPACLQGAPPGYIDFVGPQLDDARACGVADGLLDPGTGQAFSVVLPPELAFARKPAPTAGPRQPQPRQQQQQPQQQQQHHQKAIRQFFKPTPAAPPAVSRSCIYKPTAPAPPPRLLQHQPQSQQEQEQQAEGPRLKAAATSSFFGQRAGGPAPRAQGTSHLLANLQRLKQQKARDFWREHSHALSCEGDKENDGDGWEDGGAGEDGEEGEEGGAQFGGPDCGGAADGPAAQRRRSLSPRPPRPDFSAGYDAGLSPPVKPQLRALSSLFDFSAFAATPAPALPPASASSSSSSSSASEPAAAAPLATRGKKRPLLPLPPPLELVTESGSEAGDLASPAASAQQGAGISADFFDRFKCLV